MEELIWAILQFLFEVFPEVLIQIGFEWLIEALIRWFTGMFIDDAWPRGELNPRAWFIYNTVLGGCIGGISLALFPQHMIHRAWVRWMNLVITPLMVGGVMSRIGNWHEKHGRRVISLDRFWYGWAFALAFAIVRHFWCR